MRTKYLLTAALAFVGLTNIASAADLPAQTYTKAPVMPVAVFTWTGFYVGGNVGAEWSNGATSIVSVPTFASTTLSPFGISELNNATAGGTGVLSSGSRAAFIGGGQIGYNYQVRNYVVGIEADIQGLDRNSSTVSTVTSLPTTFPGVNSVSTLTAQKSVDYLGTVRGRFGALVAPAFLVYGTGGLAYGRVNSAVAIAQQAAVPFQDIGPTASGGNLSQTRAGWTAGVGGEWMFASTWSAKVEYLHYDLGTVNYGAGTRTGSSFGTPLFTHVSTASTRFSGDIVRVGINYHFSGPVVAKY